MPFIINKNGNVAIYLNRFSNTTLKTVREKYADILVDHVRID